MVAGFNRSFSLPGSPRALIKTRPANAKSCHARSVSLPCRSHPLVSQLEDEIRSVRSWQSTQPESALSTSEPSWICDGLARLDLLITSLNHFINQQAFRLGSGSEWADRIMDDFLRFADAHGTFRSEIVAVGGLLSDAQISIRRNDSAKLQSFIRRIKKTEKRLVKLAKSSPLITSTRSIEEAELASVIREVMHVTVSASASVFLGIAALLSATTAAVADLYTVRNSWMHLRKSSSPPPRISFDGVEDEGEQRGRRNAMMVRLHELEECVGAIERRSEKSFRGFVNIRVSLLNILTC